MKHENQDRYFEISSWLKISLKSAQTVWVGVSAATYTYPKHFERNLHLGKASSDALQFL